MILESFAVFSLPPGVMLGLRYAGSEPAHILAILDGTDLGQATWSPHVTKELGLYVHDVGDLINEFSEKERGDD